VHTPLSHALPTFFDGLAFIALIGALIGWLWLLPAAEGQGRVALAQQGRRQLSVLLGWALLVLTLNTFLLLVVRTLEMSHQPLAALGATLPVVIGKTHFGAVWLVRLAAVGILLGTYAFFWLKPGRAAAGFMLAAALVLAWTHSASGHAAAQGDFTLGQWLDWLHVIAGAAWGGVVVAAVSGLRLLYLSGEEIDPGLAAEVGERISRLAGVALALVLASGLYTTYVRLGAVSDLWTTLYGQFLSAKLALVALLVAIGASNRYFVLPALRRIGGTTLTPEKGLGRLLARYWPERNADPRALPARFWRRIAAEVAPFIAVIACVALLSHTPPPARPSIVDDVAPAGTPHR
jgi:putative copper resistance protein D